MTATCTFGLALHPNVKIRASSKYENQFLVQRCSEIVRCLFSSTSLSARNSCMKLSEQFSAWASTLHILFKSSTMTGSQYDIVCGVYLVLHMYIYIYMIANCKCIV